MCIFGEREASVTCTLRIGEKRWRERREREAVTHARNRRKMNRMERGETAMDSECARRRRCVVVREEKDFQYVRALCVLPK